MPLYDFQNNETGEIRQDVFFPVYESDAAGRPLIRDGKKVFADHTIPGWTKLPSRLGVVVEHCVEPTLGHRVMKALSLKEDGKTDKNQFSGEFTPDQYKRAWADDLAKKVKT